MAPRGPSEPGPMGKLLRPPPPEFIMVYRFSLELLESAGLGTMPGVPGGPPCGPPYAPGDGDEYGILLAFGFGHGGLPFPGPMFTPGMPGPIELCGGLIPPPKLWGLGPMGPIPLGTFILCIGPCSLGSMFGSIGWAVGTPPGGWLPILIGGLGPPPKRGDMKGWKNPGGMGPPGMPSPGGMFPRTGLGAAAAL